MKHIVRQKSWYSYFSRLISVVRNRIHWLCNDGNNFEDNFHNRASCYHILTTQYNQVWIELCAIWTEDIILNTNYIRLEHTIVTAEIRLHMHELFCMWSCKALQSCTTNYVIIASLRYRETLRRFTEAWRAPCLRLRRATLRKSPPDTTDTAINSPMETIHIERDLHGCMCGDMLSMGCPRFLWTQLTPNIQWHLQ